MKFAIVLAALVGVAIAASIPVLEHTETRDEAGQYNVRFLTENGIASVERGYFVPNAQHTDNDLVIEGTYSYNAPDGKTYTVHYRGDKEGFHAEGDHLPVAPQDPNV